MRVICRNVQDGEGDNQLVAVVGSGLMGTLSGAAVSPVSPSQLPQRVKSVTTPGAEKRSASPSITSSTCKRPRVEDPITSEAVSTGNNPQRARAQAPTTSTSSITRGARRNKRGAASSSSKSNAATAPAKRNNHSSVTFSPPNSLKRSMSPER